MSVWWVRFSVVLKVLYIVIPRINRLPVHKSNAKRWDMIIRLIYGSAVTAIPKDETLQFWQVYVFISSQKGICKHICFLCASYGVISA